MTHAEKNPPRIRKNTLKFLVFALLLLAVWLIGNRFSVDVGFIQDRLKGVPLFFSAIIYIFSYCVGTFFIWLSKDIFRVSGAVIFGAYLSTALVMAAELINAFVLFYFARTMGRGFVDEVSNQRVRNLDRRLSAVRFPLLVAFRAVPLIPFRFLDLAAGLTRMPFRRYLLAVLIGSLPRIFWQQYIFSAVGKSLLTNPYSLVEYLSRDTFAFIYSFVYLVAVIILAFRIKER